ncbi:hypothetical protein [Acinetobacter faecalis]|uniref:hypothetical protein n=1 Tax=Acinetobacter faecalis TaxID=2665161 RepID=UPI002A90E965|nr:hypothetical protein [Acinetobacter faecalis]MDY6531564.1 hypothetical protein [Acinetobacter faecalis]
MHLKSLFSNISICLLLGFSTNSYSGLPPKATPQIDKKVNLKRMVSNQCLKHIEFINGSFNLPDDCSHSFSTLYSKDLWFRERVSKAFKESPFDGRYFDIDSSPELIDPAGDSDDGWIVVLETVSREKNMVANIFTAPNFNELTIIISDRGLGNQKCTYGIYGDVNERNESFAQTQMYIRDNRGAFKGCKLVNKVEGFKGYDGLASF